MSLTFLVKFCVTHVGLSPTNWHHQHVSCAGRCLILTSQFVCERPTCITEHFNEV